MSGQEQGYVFSKLVKISGDEAIDTKSPSYTKTNFNVNLGTNFQKVTRVSVSHVTFRNNAYNVNASGLEQNNGLTLNIVSGLLTGQYSTAIPGGFYTTSQLMTAINTWSSGAHAYIVLTQDPISNLVTITITPTFSPITSIYLQNGYQGASVATGIWDLLGFNIGSGTLYFPPLSGGSASLTATYFPSLGGLTNVFLQSHELAPGNTFDENGDQKSYLMGIPVTAAFGALNVFECKVDSLCQITYPTPRNIQNVDFSLVDKQGDLVDLHGSNLQIGLRIWYNRY